MLKFQLNRTILKCLGFSALVIWKFIFWDLNNVGHFSNLGFYLRNIGKEMADLATYYITLQMILHCFLNAIEPKGLTSPR